jgi:two-component system chemotaxis response regulator CheB
VVEPGNGDVLLEGKAFIARGDHHLTVQEEKFAVVTRLNRGRPVSRFRPSIDVMMDSTSLVFRERNVGVIMTGMCDDGVNGVRAIRERGGHVVAQDESTSVIFGMNRTAIESGYVDRVEPLERIVPTLMDLLGQVDIPAIGGRTRRASPAQKPLPRG